MDLQATIHGNHNYKDTQCTVYVLDKNDLNLVSDGQVGIRHPASRSRADVKTEAQRMISDKTCLNPSMRLDESRLAMQRLCMLKELDKLDQIEQSGQSIQAKQAKLNALPAGRYSSYEDTLVRFFYRKKSPQQAEKQDLTSASGDSLTDKVSGMH